MSRCYHYTVDGAAETGTGTCERCGATVRVIPGHLLRLSFAGATDGATVWVATVSVGRSPSVVESLAHILGVATDAITVVDVAPDGEYWNQTLRVTWTLRGSRVSVTSWLTVSDADHRDPESTELDEDGRPVVEAAL